MKLDQTELGARSQKYQKHPLAIYTNYSAMTMFRKQIYLSNMTINIVFWSKLNMKQPSWSNFEVGANCHKNSQRCLPL